MQEKKCIFKKFIKADCGTTIIWFFIDPVRIRNKSAGLCASGVLSLAKSRYKREQPFPYSSRGILPPLSGISHDFLS